MSDRLGKSATAAAASRRSQREKGGTAMLEVGQRALSEGRFEDARRAFEAALSEDGKPEALEGLGWAALWRDDVAAGISAFEDAHRVYLEGEDRRARDGLRSRSRTAIDTSAASRLSPAAGANAPSGYSRAFRRDPSMYGSRSPPLQSEVETPWRCEGSFVRPRR